MKTKEFSAWLQIDGIKLPEWAVMRIGNSIECYIPSIPGEKFSVHWSCDQPALFSSGYIFIDGKAYPGRFLQGQSTTHRSGARSGPTSERPFTFMATKRADEVLGEDRHPLGTVQLKIVLTERGEGRPNSYTKAAPAPPQQVNSIPRNSGHRAGLGKDQPTTTQFPRTWEGKPIGALPNAAPRSYVKFIFKYRPMEWIKLYGIDDIKDLGGCDPVPPVAMSEESKGQATTEEYQEAISKFMRFIVETEGVAAARRLFPNMEFNVSYGPMMPPPAPPSAPVPLGNISALPDLTPMPNLSMSSSHLYMPSDWGVPDETMADIDWSLPNVSTPQNASNPLLLPPMQNALGSNYQYPADAYPAALRFPSPKMQLQQSQQSQSIALPALLQSPFQQRTDAAPADSPMWDNAATPKSSAPLDLPAQVEPQVEPQSDSESESEREPTPKPQPKPKRRYRTKEQIAADKAAKEKERQEWEADIKRREDEIWAKREAAGEKRPPPTDWDMLQQRVLKGRTWEEVMAPLPTYKGYKFTKGEKPSLKWKEDQEKKAAAEEVAKAGSNSKGKGKEKASVPPTESQRPSLSRTASIASAPTSISPRHLLIPQGLSITSSSEAAPSQASSSTLPSLCRPLHIHGFMNMYPPVQTPQPADDPPPTTGEVDNTQMMTAKQFEEMILQGKK